MPELSREEKLAAAHQKLKRFQQNKANREGVCGQNQYQDSNPNTSTTAHVVHAESSAFTVPIPNSFYSNNANGFPPNDDKSSHLPYSTLPNLPSTTPDQTCLLPAPNSTVQYYHPNSSDNSPYSVVDLSSVPTNKPHSLTDYFSSSNNDATGNLFETPMDYSSSASATVPNFYVPSESLPAPAPPQQSPMPPETISNQTITIPEFQSTYHSQPTMPFDSTGTNSTYDKAMFASDPLTMQDTSPLMVQTNAISSNHLEPVPPVSDRENSDAEEEIVGPMPTAATEKILQISRQVDGILQTSEQLTASFQFSGATSPDDQHSPNSSLCQSFTAGDTWNPGLGHGISDTLYTSDMKHAKQSSSPISTTPKRSGSFLQSSNGSFNQTSLIRDLEERNVELAAMLEKRNRAHERTLAKLTALQDQFNRLTNEAAQERANLEATNERDLNKAKDQIRVHAQTIGVLVAEKTELQTQVSHLERLANQRSQEIDEINQRYQSLREQTSELERSGVQFTGKIGELQTKINDLTHQLERSQNELKREKAQRTNLQTELEESYSRINAKGLEMSQLEIRLNELKRQLELSQVYANQLNGSGPTDLSSNGFGPDLEDLVAQLSKHTKRIQELETALNHANSDRNRLESQYKTYVSQVEKQADELRTELSETMRSKQDLELNLDSVRKNLRETEEKLADSVHRLKLAETQHTSNQLVQSDLAAQSNQTSSSAESDQMKDQIKDLEDSLRVRLDELNKAHSEIQDLTLQLAAAQEQISETKLLLADRESVLAQATSERVALGRAIEQNRDLKQQFTELQDAFVKMSTTNMNLTTDLQKEQHACKETLAALSNCQIRLEHLTELYDQQSIELNTLRQQNAAICASLSDKATDHQDQTTARNPPSNSIAIEANLLLEQGHFCESDTHETQPVPNDSTFEQITKVKEEQSAIVPDSNDQTQLPIELSKRLESLRDWFEKETSPNWTMTLPYQTRNPETNLTILENSIKQYVQSCKNAFKQTGSKQDDSNCEMELQQLRITYSQLETKFLDCMNRLGLVSEERSRLEALVAQLEIEASTVDEYVTLFTHRRAAASRRALAREQLLRRLVEDRKELRCRLNRLLEPIRSNLAVKSKSEDETQSDEPDCKLTNLPETFLAELQRLVQEVEISAEESEFESGVSDYNDEDAEEKETISASQAQTLTSATLANRKPSSLEELRLQALQHDCPHCKCCSGRLLEL